MKPTKKDKQKTSLVLPQDYIFLNQTVQDFMPFEDIRDMMYCLPGDLYRAVVEVKSINYYLKTEEEQEVLEAQFRSALSSWDFSFAFYTQTRTIDSDDIIRRLQEDIGKLDSRELRSYGNDYISEMTNLTKKRNGNLIKKNYIIVSCNDAGTIENNRTRQDKDIYAFDKLSLDTRKIYESLTPMGLVCHTLTNEELLELMFVAINKHSMLRPSNVIDFMTNFTSGKSEWDIGKVDLLLEGWITTLRTMMLTDHSLSASECEKAQKIVADMEKIRSSTKDENNDLFVL